MIKTRTNQLLQNQKNSLHIFPLQVRKKAIESEISVIANKLLFEKKFYRKQSIQLAIHADIFTMPSVSLNAKKSFLIQIPPLFLFESQDFFSQLDARNNLIRELSQSSITRKQWGYLAAFEEYIQDPILSKKAKTFTLAHEISHISLNHLNCSECTLEKSQRNEFAADQLAIETIPDALEGGIYLLNVLNRHLPKQPILTHPPIYERLEKLKAFQRDRLQKTCFQRKI